MTKELEDFQVVARGLFFNLKKEYSDGMEYHQCIPGEKGCAIAQPVKNLGPIGNVSMIDHKGVVQIFFFTEKRPCAGALKKGPIMQIDIGKDYQRSGGKKVLISHPHDLTIGCTEVLAPIIKKIGAIKEADTCRESLRVIYEVAPVTGEKSASFY